MPTTIFAVPLQVATDMQDTAFPQHPVTLVSPEVNPADYPTAHESVVVLSRANDDDAVAEWVSMGEGGKDERYIVDVVVTTQVPGATWVEMMDRLAELTAIVLAKYTNATTGSFVPPGGTTGANENPYGIWDGMANAERQHQWGTDEGWAGQCLVALRISASI